MRERTMTNNEGQHLHSQTYSNQHMNYSPLNRGIHSVLSDVTNVIPSVRTETHQSCLTPTLETTTKNTRFQSDGTRTNDFFSCKSSTCFKFVRDSLS